MKHYFGMDLETQRKALLASAFAKPMIEAAVKKADEAVGATYEALTLSAYKQFYKDGDRRTFEKKMNRFTDALENLTLAYWLTEDEQYSEPLQDVIFHICNLWTWCPPAHVHMERKPSFVQMLGYVDLGAASTASRLTMTAALVGDKLPYYIKERIAYEIQRRIGDGLLQNEEGFWWETSCYNWVATCAGGSLVALIHFGTEEQKKKLLPRLKKDLDNFLLGMGEEGCCLEGSMYWNCGIGDFLLAAGVLKEYSKGEVDYFQDPRLQKYALFPQRATMSEDLVLCFSDCNPDSRFRISYLCYLKSFYPEVCLPVFQAADQRSVCTMRDFMWLNANYQPDGVEKGLTYFEHAQWYIKRGDKFSFAAKGGNNGEPHNHNDIGSFMLVTGKVAPLTDLGRAVYTDKTFKEEFRYTMLNNASFGHSVPILGETYQKPGADFKARDVKATPNGFSLDLAGAYEAGAVESLVRTFVIEEDKVLLCDKVVFGKETCLTERFVTHVKPVLTEGCVHLETADLCYDPKRYRASYKETSYRDDFDTKDILAYLIDIKSVSKEETEFTFTIEIL